MQPLGTDSSKGGSRAGFATTHWTMVYSAASVDSEQAGEALTALCQDYWYPLYAFVRREGQQSSDAQDLVQAFFAQLLEKEELRRADPAKGRFRSFLLTSFKHFLSNRRQYEQAQKRGGGQTVLSLNFPEGESRYGAEPADAWSPEALFQRRWALAVLERTLQRLREYYRQSEKEALFDALKTFLIGSGDGPPHAELAEQLKMTPGAVKVAIHRLRQKYGTYLREQVAQTVASHDDVEDEVQQLLRALRGPEAST